MDIAVNKKNNPTDKSIPTHASWIYKRSNALIELIVGIAVVAELVIMLGNMLLRTFTGKSLVWSLEAATIALCVITFVGGALAFWRGEHMAMKALVIRLPRPWQINCEVMGNWLVVVLAVLSGISAVRVAIIRSQINFVTIPVSQSWLIAPIIVGMFLMVVFALEKQWKQPKKTVALTGLITMVLVGLFWGFGTALGQSGALGLIFVLFVVLLLMGLPISFILPLMATQYLFSSAQAPLVAIPQTMLAGISNILLMAIPFFVLTGFIMTEGGISKRLANAIIAGFGHVRGGLLQVTVISMFIFSGLSGSKTADVAAVGTTMKDMLARNGYDPAESTAVVASSAVMGETIPPSIVMLVLGSISTLSTGALFLAGVLPAMVIGLCLMIAIYIRATMFGMKPGTRASWSTIISSSITALPSAVVPILLIGGIVSGMATATEVSSTAVIYTLVLALFYREMNLKGVWQQVVRTAVTTGMILFIVSGATAFSWALTIANIPVMITTLLNGLGNMHWLFMLGTIITLVVMGALLEGLPALLIFGPLLIPIAESFGIDPLQYGIVLIIAMGLGSFLPPIGVNMYVTCAIMGVTMEEAGKRMLPYIVVLFVGILLVAYIPQISLVIPHMFNK